MSRTTHRVRRRVLHRLFDDSEPIHAPRTMTPLLRFLKNEDGPTAVEYAVMLALILLAVMTSVKALQTKTGEVFDDCGDALNGVGF